MVMMDVDGWWWMMDDEWWMMVMDDVIKTQTLGYPVYIFFIYANQIYIHI